MAAFQDPSHDERRRGAVPPASGHSAGTRPADVSVTRTGAAPVAAPRGGRPWLWLLPLLLLFAIGIALTRGRPGAEPEVAALDPANPVNAANAPVAAAAGGEVVADAGAVSQFVTWAGQGGNAVLPQESEETHPYTTQGLRLMADALGAATAGHGGDHAQAVQRIRSQAALLQASAGDDRHAEYAHAAFMDAARVIGALRGGDVRNELTVAAARVQPGRPLGAQGTEVRAFFRAAAAQLQPPPRGTVPTP